MPIVAPPLKARPTTYKGVRMRSRLEAGFAAWLDDAGVEWQYEPECYSAPELGQWLPDFLISAWVLDEYALSLTLLEAPTDLIPPLAARRRLLIDVKPRPAGESLIERWQAITDANFVLADRPLAVCACPGNVWHSAIGEHLVHHAEAGLILGDAPVGPWVGEWWRGDQ